MSPASSHWRRCSGLKWKPTSDPHQCGSVRWRINKMQTRKWLDQTKTCTKGKKFSPSLKCAYEQINENDKDQVFRFILYRRLPLVWEPNSRAFLQNAIADVRWSMSLDVCVPDVHPDPWSISDQMQKPTTLILVRVVPAVVVIVTLPAAGNTAVVFTAELIWLTRPLICIYSHNINAVWFLNNSIIQTLIFYKLRDS